MTTHMNTWEEQAMIGQLSNPRIQDPLIYPGLYSPSGIDILTILTAIHTRPNPTVTLGAIDASCALLITDLAQPDHPIIYASQPFTALTGYTPAEALGRNCRFLQAPPLPPVSRLVSASAAGRIAVRQQGDGGGNTAALLDGGERGKMVGGGGNGYGVARRRGYGVDMEVVRRMRAAVEMRHEVQVEVVNYKKSGEPFLNVLSIIPVKVASRLGRGGGGGGMDLSVGFLCDAASLE
ncbi:vivid PAS protein VVD [Chaetomium tenue]|uniref:Vivid PAS protein VVD n=1 Tax=Chaetomium tenue TaxID=1854479 RepID=A0ACB7PEZ2_9PEZI|nr:vivid PAS protein VVD [Chaetomium globosum]